MAILHHLFEAKEYPLGLARRIFRVGNNLKNSAALVLLLTVPTLFFAQELQPSRRALIAVYTEAKITLEAYCHDPRPDQIILRDIARDFEWSEQDVFGFHIDTFNDGRNGFMMLTT